jgi:hypothetical protein
VYNPLGGLLAAAGRFSGGGIMFSKVKAGGAAGIVVAMIVAGLTAAGYEPDATTVAIITTVVSTLIGWLKKEVVGRYA